MRVDYEPPHFGHLVQFEATVSGKPVPLTIKAASFRTATVVAVSDAAVPIGLDIRDLRPDEITLREMRRHSHLIDGGSDQVAPRSLDPGSGRPRSRRPRAARAPRARAAGHALKKGWVSDRKVYYRIQDLSRDAWLITLAYGGFPKH